MWSLRLLTTPEFKGKATDYNQDEVPTDSLHYTKSVRQDLPIEPIDLKLIAVAEVRNMDGIEQDFLVVGFMAVGPPLRTSPPPRESPPTTARARRRLLMRSFW